MTWAGRAIREIPALVFVRTVLFARRGVERDLRLSVQR